MHGRFSETGITIPIEVYGTAPEHKKTITALVDTGFNGYLTLPFVEAFPLGLVLKGEQSYAMADGSISRHFVCFGTVIFEGVSATIPIDVQPGGQILLGLQLLKKFGHQLSINFREQRFEFIRTSAPAPRLARRPLKGVTLTLGK